MGASEKFCLKWNDFEANISLAFRELREDKDFFDITLVCEDEQLEAHKVVLSACSPFFRALLKRNKHQHPMLYLRGVQAAELVAVLTFMYHGEVNVAQEELNSFLGLAEDLQVKGLTQGRQKPVSGAAGRQTSGDTKPNPSNKRSHSQTRLAEGGEPPSKQCWPPPAPPAPTATFPGEDKEQQEGEIEEVEDDLGGDMVTLVKSEPASNMSALVDTTQTEDFGDGYEDFDSYQFGGETAAGGDLATVGGHTKDVDSLMQPVVTDSGELWQCLVCGKICKRKYILKDHVESLHISGGPGHPCELCLKMYKTRNSLQNHMSTYHKSRDSEHMLTYQKLREQDNHPL